MIPVELLYGIIVSMVNIFAHSVVIVTLVRFMLGLGLGRVHHRRMFVLAGLMMLAGAALTFSHLFQVWIWAIAYQLVGAVQDRDAYYFAFESFTTVGYGDVLPVPRWRVLGPITAANGMLLFGASTALVFAILTQAASALHLFDPHRRTKPPEQKAAKAASSGAPPEH